MPRKQSRVESLLKSYHEDKFIKVTLKGNIVTAINNATGCKQIFRDGKDHVVLQKNELTKAQKYIDTRL